MLHQKWSAKEELYLSQEELYLNTGLSMKTSNICFSDLQCESTEFIDKSFRGSISQDLYSLHKFTIEFPSYCKNVHRVQHRQTMYLHVAIVPNFKL